jgi:glucose dehydrogenase
MANKQIKDFEVITDGTGTSILVQNNTTDTYNKISAENIAAAATVLSKAITAQENITIQKQLILDNDENSSRIKYEGESTNWNNQNVGVIDLDFTGDINQDEVWGLKINNGSESYKS